MSSLKNENRDFFGTELRSQPCLIPFMNVSLIMFSLNKFLLIIQFNSVTSAM